MLTGDTAIGNAYIFVSLLPIRMSDLAFALVGSVRQTDAFPPAKVRATKAHDFLGYSGGDFGSAGAPVINKGGQHAQGRRQECSSRGFQEPRRVAVEKGDRKRLKSNGDSRSSQLRQSAARA
jgi:hypothetical protein